MKFKELIRRKKVWIPCVVILLPCLLIVGVVVYQLRTSAPSMYHNLSATDGALYKEFSDQTEMVLFTSLRPSNWDIYLFDDVEADPRRLTTHPNNDYNAEISPDGNWVVFVSDRDGNANLYAMDLNSEGVLFPLTAHPAMDDAPTFSPDGRQLAFVSTRGGNPDIHTMKFSPGDLSADDQAVNLTNSSYGDFNPDFSNDGSRIAFSSNRAVFGDWNPLRLAGSAGMFARTDIYVMDADGSNVKQIAGDSAKGSGAPVWGDDDKTVFYYQWDVVFRIGRDERVISSVELATGNVTIVSPKNLNAVTPTPASDNGLYFVAFDDDVPAEDRPALIKKGGAIYRVNSDGMGLKRIQEGDNHYLAPHYHAASKRLVCHGDGPVDAKMQMSNGTPFTWDGARQAFQLQDRVLGLQAMRCYFPSSSARKDGIAAIEWVHPQKGSPRGPSPIVLRRIDGSELRHVLPSGDDAVAWSPVVNRDGEWIFFSKGPPMASPDADVDIWKVRIDGTDATNLTADSDANDALPDVSADGKWIVFRSGRDGSKQIYLMDNNGKRLRRVSVNGGSSTMPAISPDGKQVVYSTSRFGGGFKLCLQSLEDPHDEGRLLEPDRASLTGGDMHPRFSPDGKWIVFISDRAGFMDEWPLCGRAPQPYGEVFAIPTDGSSKAVRLTNDKWEDGLPYWCSQPTHEAENATSE